VLPYASPHVAIFLGIYTLDGQGRNIAHLFFAFLSEKRSDTATASGIRQRIHRSAATGTVTMDEE